MTAQSIRFFFAALTVLAAGSAAAQSERGAHHDNPTLAFVGVDVVPMTGSGVLRDHTVLVRDGHVVAVGPSAEVGVPDGAEVVDGRGRYLIPGLADMHVHLEHFDDPAVLQLFVVQGVTTVRNMDGRPYLLGWRDGTASGALLGPRIVTAGPILDGDPPLRGDNVALATPAAARAAVREQAAVGYDFVKVYTNLAPGVYAAVVDEAAAVGLPVVGHVPRGLNLEEVMAAGQAAVEHLDGYDDAIEATDSPYHGRWHWSKLYLAMPTDPERVRAAARMTAAAGTWNVPTLVVKEKLAPLDTVRAWLRRPEVAYVPPALRAVWAPEGWDPGHRATVEGAGPEEWTLLERGRANRLALTRALHEAGAGVLAGTDTPNPFVVPGLALHEELVLLQEAGLSPYEALAAATRSAAAFLGEAGEWGVVAPGARADLVLLGANPLMDIRNVGQVEGVVVRGRWLPRGEVEAVLAGVVEAYAGR